MQWDLLYNATCTIYCVDRDVVHLIIYTHAVCTQRETQHRPRIILCLIHSKRAVYTRLYNNIHNPKVSEESLGAPSFLCKLHVCCFAAHCISNVDSLFIRQSSASRGIFIHVYKKVLIRSQRKLRICYYHSKYRCLSASLASKVDFSVVSWW